jgi:starch synthase
MSLGPVALISPEITPFAKTGGLADMVGSLGLALKNQGLEPVFFLPKYRVVPAKDLEGETIPLRFLLGETPFSAQIRRTKDPHGIPTYLIDLPEFFDRKGLYGEGGHDYPDNGVRFAAFSRAVLEALKVLEIRASVLHVHDWQTSLLPLFFKAFYCQDPFFEKSRAFLTLHNLGYQGLFPREDLGQMGLHESYFVPRMFEFYGKLNLLKGGILSADAVTTVSPTYAREILTAQWGFGLEGVLKERSDRFFGILNGLDERAWDPETDPALPAPFSPRDLSGKDRCKTALQKEMNLPEKTGAPIMGLVSRLVDQKGIDLLLEIIPGFEHMEIQWVILGQGDPWMEGELSRLAEIYPEQLAVKIGFDESLARRIIAGSDFMLMPSRYEPCGYNQMYAMRYGTVPVVTRVGGLADTVKDMEEDREEGTGIILQKAAAQDLQGAVLRAIEFYRKPGVWDPLRRRIMGRDFSWKASASKYINIYEKILSEPPVPLPL